MRIFYHANAEGGAANNASPEGGAADNSQADPAQKPEGGTGGEAGDTGKDAPTVETLQKELADWKGKHDHVTKKLGEQAKIVGEYNKLTEAIQDPARFQKFATKKFKELGIDDGDKAPDLTKIFEDETQAQAIQQIVGQMQKQVEQQISPQMRVAYEHIMSSRYEDWEDSKTERETLKAQYPIPDDEFYHLAVRGKNLPDILKDHEKELREKWEKELADKEQEQIESGGEGGEGGKPSETQSFDTFLGSFKEG